MSTHTPFRQQMRPPQTPKTLPTKRTISESDDSVSSSNPSEGSATSNNNSNGLSIVAEFDDLMRLIKPVVNSTIEERFYLFAEECLIVWEKCIEATQECKRLQNELDLRTREVSEIDMKLSRARDYLDEERKRCRRIQRDKEELGEQLDKVRELVLGDRNKLADDTREKLSFLTRIPTQCDYRNFGGNNKHLSAIQEINSTGSILSDYSISKSGDELEDTRPPQYHKEHLYQKKYSNNGPTSASFEPERKKRRSSNFVEISQTDTVRATTTVLVTKDGPITATSIIESVPNKADPHVDRENGTSSTNFAASAPPSDLVLEHWAKSFSPKKPPRTLLHPHDNSHCQRQHSLQVKTIVMPEVCVCCEKRIKFGKNAIKCKECRSICHAECKDKLVLPCVPVPNTPNQKNAVGNIGDYAPSTSPMVPALIVHCINEIEYRGLTEIGLYRVPGSEKDVKNLKEKFLKGKGTPALTQLDIHVICGCIKDFLRSLNDRIIPRNVWNDFVHAVEANDRQDVAPALYECIAQLPQANRDTLAFLMMHLQRIAIAKECKMPAENLAVVFGPNIVGFSSDEPSLNTLLIETKKQVAVVRNLLEIPSEFWKSFITASLQPTTGRLQQTPSKESMLQQTGRFLSSSSVKSGKRPKLFATPPILNGH